jgi:hypothetical protein
LATNFVHRDTLKLNYFIEIIIWGDWLIFMHKQKEKMLRLYKKIQLLFVGFMIIYIKFSTDQFISPWPARISSCAFRRHWNLSERRFPSTRYILWKVVHYSHIRDCKGKSNLLKLLKFKTRILKNFEVKIHIIQKKSTSQNCQAISDNFLNLLNTHVKKCNP